MKENKLGFRFWISILLVGLIGQLAWAIENNYINLWVYSQTSNADAITWMTITSSIAATLTTFFIGLLSDRLGKRKLFINIGYIIWGLSVFCFGLFSYHNMLSISGDQATAIILVGVFITLVDNVMTFFGSSSNDAAFNAWVTEHTDDTNRGKVESVISILPLLANVLMMGIGLPLHIGSSTNGDDYLKELIANGTYADSQEALAHGWFLYFLITGIIVTVVGVVSIFLLPKDNCVPNRDGAYMKKLIHGFKPSVIKENKELYLLLLVFLCFNAGINAFMPYYLVYFQNPTEYYGANFGIGIDFYIALVIIMGGASIITVLIGAFLMNKVDQIKLFYVALGVGAIGALGIYITSLYGSNHILLIIFGLLLITGYLLCTAVLGAGIRNKTPEKDVGLFQGVRMVFAVLIPMIVGPLISQALFPTTEYNDPTNANLGGKTPSSVMFLVSLAFFVLSLVPMFFYQKELKKKTISLGEKENEQENNHCDTQQK